MPSKITLVFDPECTDGHERQTCERYWERSSDGKWVHDIKVLAKLANSAANGFGYYVERRCHARAEMVCACGATETQKFEFREDIDKLRECPWACKTCTNKRLQEERETRERLIAERNAELNLEFERRAAERQAAEVEEQIRRENWRRKHTLGEPQNPQTVHLRFAMYWYALLRCFEEPWVHGISAVSSMESLWIGDASKEEETLKYLKNAGLLYIDPESPIPKGLDAKIDFPLLQVGWRLSAPEYDELARSYFIDSAQMLPDPSTWPPFWRGQYVVIFEEIAWMECWRYWQSLNVAVDENDLKSIVCEALAVLSVGQVAWVMWGAANDAIRRNQKYGRRSRYKISRSALISLRERLRSAMKDPSTDDVRALHAHGVATVVALSIMSGTGAPWYTVSMRNVHELLRVADGNTVDDWQNEADEGALSE
jgi:hypothetical protein